jgi:CheY-like chemotaxis protein
MNTGGAVVLIGSSSEMERALDALEEYRHMIRVLPDGDTASDSIAAVMGVEVAGARVRAVLVRRFDPLEDVVALVHEIRTRPATALAPIVVWGSFHSDDERERLSEAGVSSLLHLPSEPRARVLSLTGMVHYWTALNEAPPVA